MHHFQYMDNALYCEDVSVAEIARAVGTPFYLYSHATLKQHFEAFDGAFSGIRHITCFSMKSNSSGAILALFAAQGGGVDIVSGGELYRALKAGVDPRKIVYSGVGKRPEDLAYALDSNILMFNVESSQEMSVLNRVAEASGRRAPVSIRVNPDVDPKTHPYISTGLKENKFGIDIDQAFEEYARAAECQGLNVIGVSCHIGSQLTQVSPFLEALRKLKAFMSRLKGAGIDIQYLDLGGGLGITYEDEVPPHPREYARAIEAELASMEVTLILEPGRVIVGNAGILVSRVLYTKPTKEKMFFVVDAAMNDLIRPSLYNAYHGIQPVLRSDKRSVTADIVGPICETGDFLAKDRVAPAFEPGDLMAVMTAGAYGFTMSSTYNSRPRSCEVMAKGEDFFTIRKRETYADLIRGEEIPEGLIGQI